MLRSIIILYLHNRFLLIVICASQAKFFLYIFSHFSKKLMKTFLFKFVHFFNEYFLKIF